MDVHEPVFRSSPLTCTIDGLAHLVSDDAAAAGVAAGRGTYGALCGHTVHAAALVSSAGRPCPRCAAHFETLHATVEVATRRTRRIRRSGGTRLQRLLAQIRTVAPSGSPRPLLGVFGFSIQAAGTGKRLERRKTV